MRKRTRGRILGWIVFAGLMMIVPFASPATLAEPGSYVGALNHVNATLFWDEPTIDPTIQPWLPQVEPLLYTIYCGADPTGATCRDFIGEHYQLLCGSPPYQCFDYQFDGGVSSSPHATRLRVGTDHEKLEDHLEMLLYDPHMNLVAREPLEHSGISTGGNVLFNLFSNELFAANPIPGTWTLRVIPHKILRPAHIRMRAKFERLAASTNAASVRQLLPNLRARPAFEIGLAACLPTETADGAHQCLRLSTGPENVGEGRLHVIYEHSPTGECQAKQMIYLSNGTTELRDSGPCVYHQEHAHYHHDGTTSFYLYKVDRSSGSPMLVLAGESPKVGFCMTDFLIAEWFSFSQEQRRDIARFESCNNIPVGQGMGLSIGWTDIYPYWAPDNYIEFNDPDDAFPINGDGEYVIRITTDPPDPQDSRSVGDFLESNEQDNVSYTWFTISATDTLDPLVQVFERGYGNDPWDLNKQILTTDIRRGACDQVCELFLPGDDAN